MGSVPTSRVSLFERPCAAFVEGVLTGVFIGMVVAVTLATPMARAATLSGPPPNKSHGQTSQQYKLVVSRSDPRLPSYDCQQARRNYEGAAAVPTSTARELDSRRNAMHVVCSFSPPNRGVNSLNNMNMNVNDLMPNHKTCKDEQDLNCFRHNLKY